tara:strand:+ start:235 stop:474 length:240 start_codon:yes stop_codon:yes gene_type:complete
MKVSFLQEFLAKFSTGSDAVKNAQIFVEVNGKLYDVRRMEVHEHTLPIIGHKGHSSHRLVLKTSQPTNIVLPDKLQKDY